MAADARSVFSLLLFPVSDLGRFDEICVVVSMLAENVVCLARRFGCYWYSPDI